MALLRDCLVKDLTPSVRFDGGRKLGVYQCESGRREVLL